MEKCLIFLVNMQIEPRLVVLHAKKKTKMERPYREYALVIEHLPSMYEPRVESLVL